MFIVASSGRCATVALARGLAEHSDHEVHHEPEPRLLAEAHARHVGGEWRTEEFHRRMAMLSEREGQRYGETWRAPNLLDEVHNACPTARFLVLVRDPVEYVLSAHWMGVLEREDDWDRWRLLPQDLSGGSLSSRITAHWATVNKYLLDFAEDRGVPVRIVRPLDSMIDDVVSILGVEVDGGLRETWTRRWNATEAPRIPEGFDLEHIRAATGDLWRRTRQLERSTQS